MWFQGLRLGSREAPSLSSMTSSNSSKVSDCGCRSDTSVVCSSVCVKSRRNLTIWQSCPSQADCVHPHILHFLGKIYPMHLLGWLKLKEQHRWAINASFLGFAGGGQSHNSKTEIQDAARNTTHLEGGAGVKACRNLILHILTALPIPSHDIPIAHLCYLQHQMNLSNFESRALRPHHEMHALWSHQ